MLYYTILLLDLVKDEELIP